jgi:hypothetical protein
MADNSQHEMNTNNSESEVKYEAGRKQRQDANTKPEFSDQHTCAGLPKLRQPSKCIGNSSAVDLYTVS